MRFVNLTPHAIVVRIGESETFETFEPSGSVARVASKSGYAGHIDGIAIERTEFGAVEGIPAPQEGVMYLVSGMVLDRAGREDLVAPGTQVRDSTGRVTHCTSLRRQSSERYS